MDEKNEPTIWDHLGDRKPQTIAPVVEERRQVWIEEDPEDCHLRVRWLLAAEAFAGTAIGTGALAALHPPTWLAVISAAVIATGIVWSWTAMRRARAEMGARHGEA